MGNVYFNLDVSEILNICIFQVLAFINSKHYICFHVPTFDHSLKAFSYQGLTGAKRPTEKEILLS